MNWTTPQRETLRGTGAVILSRSTATVKSRQPAPALLAAALWLLPLAAVLVLLAGLAREFPTPVLAGLLALPVLVLSAGDFLRLRISRVAWLRGWMHTDSPLGRWLRGGLVGLLLALLKALILVPLLVLALLQEDPRTDALLLLLALPLLLALFALSHRVLRRHVHHDVLPEACARTALILSWPVLCSALVMVSLHRPGPDFTDIELLDAVRYQGAVASARSPWLELGLEYAGHLHGLRLWLAQQVTAGLGQTTLAVAAWLLLVVQSGLVAWVWLRCCVAVILLRNALPGRQAQP